jgi:CobQ-like glutamine amidotransferase family enzyme
MIKLATFMPTYFNNNGDQGNIEVLAKQLEWRGVQYSMTSTDFADSDFLLVGDGSRAVMREFESELAAITDLVAERLRTGKATLLVGSTHEFFCSRLPGLPELQGAPRVSEHREVSSGDLRVFGYRNNEIDNDLFIEQAFISTSLFGPILAKNENLLNLVLTSMGVTTELPAVHQSRLAPVLQGVRSKALGS